MEVRSTAQYRKLLLTHYDRYGKAVLRMASHVPTPTSADYMTSVRLRPSELSCGESAHEESHEDSSLLTWVRVDRH